MVRRRVGEEEARRWLPGDTGGVSVIPFLPSPGRGEAEASAQRRISGLIWDSACI